MVDVFNLACISNKRGPIFELNSKSAFESEERCLEDYSASKSITKLRNLENLNPQYLTENPHDLKLLYHLNHEIHTVHNFEQIYPGGFKKNEYYSQFFDNGALYNDVLQQKFLSLDVKSRHNVLKAAGQMIKNEL